MSSILIIGPAWVGDMVMAQSLCMVLRQRDPGAVIDLVGPPWSVPLAQRMPEVRQGLALDVAHGRLGLRARWQLGRQLRSAGYDRAIVLPRSFKAALVPRIAGIPVRTGYRAELRAPLLNDRRPLDRERLDQTIKRFIALGLAPWEPLPDPLPFPRLRIDTANQADLLARHGLGQRHAVALMPGAAYGPAKQWPPESFRALAAALALAGREVWVIGSAGEQALGAAIAEGNPLVHNLCGLTRLTDTVDLLAAADAAVTNDSGLMHVAAAAGTRVVAIYGSSSPRFTPPLTARADILWLELSCSPCFERSCPLGHLRCLRDISPERVLSKVLAALAV